MTDTPPVANFSAEQVAALSPENRTAFAASLKQAGFDAADVDAKLTAAAPPVAPATDKGEPASSVGPLDVPPDPNGYKFDYSAERLTMDTGALAKFTAELRGALHHAEAPTALAQSVLDALDASAALYPPTMTDVERVAVFQSEGFKLRRSFGPDGAREIGALASSAWQRLPEAWRTKVDAQFGFHSALGQVALAGLERAYRARQARGPK